MSREKIGKRKEKKGKRIGKASDGWLKTSLGIEELRGDCSSLKVGFGECEQAGKAFGKEDYIGI